MTAEPKPPEDGTKVGQLSELMQWVWLGIDAGWIRADEPQFDAVRPLDL